jgi:IS1 family transposase
MNRLRRWKTAVYCTDHWEAYAAAIPAEMHRITKRETAPPLNGTMAVNAMGWADSDDEL